MEVISSVSDLFNRLSHSKSRGLTVGFVPTMGNLHDGHISLVNAARRECDVVVTSIFVNPLQFGANEDLDTYPRTLENDTILLKHNDCDILFIPSVQEMYPDGRGLATVVDMPQLSQLYCGVTRPQFFKGIATVVTKFLCMILPDIAYFGEKDRQQLTIIKQVVSDLSIPVKIESVHTKRAVSGLALSSRNGYLSQNELSTAAALYRILFDIGQQLLAGSTAYSQLESVACDQLTVLGFVPDYVRICRLDNLLPMQEGEEELAILAAATLNGTRLIDNIALDIKNNRYW